MDKKSKFNLGLSYDKIRQVKFRFTEEERKKIIKDYLESNCTKREIWKKYTGQDAEHGQLLRWLREYGYENQPKNLKFTSNTETMQDKQNKDQETFENLKLEKRIQELEKQLKEAELKAIAFSTMVDIAEKEFNINIRKKFNTKPSK